MCVPVLLLITTCHNQKVNTHSPHGLQWLGFNHPSRLQCVLCFNLYTPASWSFLCCSDTMTSPCSFVSILFLKGPVTSAFLHQGQIFLIFKTQLKRIYSRKHFVTHLFSFAPPWPIQNSSCVILRHPLHIL